MNITIPQFKTNDKFINRAFRTAYSDIIGSVWKHQNGLLTEPCEVILAGMGYYEPWTRDTAINVWNCCGLLLPEASKNTLISVLCEDEHGLRVGGEYWDAVIWITGAWNYYLYTGDMEFLSMAYTAAQNTIKYFENTEFDESLNLFRGPACYGDGVAAYPDIYAEGGMSGIISFTDFHPELKAERGVGIPMYCLSTNCLYYNGYVLADKMADTLGYDRAYEEKARMMRQAINKHFWLEDKGYYRYIVDDFGSCDHQEGLGHSFAILFGVANEEQTRRILENQYMTEQGISCVWPTFKRYSRCGEEQYGRHSGVIWPHVEGFWADAATKNGRLDVLEKELRVMTDRAVRDGHFAEIYHPTTGEIYGGMQEDCGRGIRSWRSVVKQTWSATSYIRMILMDIIGMSFTETGITFAPNMVAGLENIELENITYRGSNLNVSVNGGGKKVKSISVNGKTCDMLVPTGDEVYNVVICME